MPSPKLNPKLIITADDYGLNKYCNKGIRDGVEKGIISSVHVMMNLVDDNEMNLLIKAVRDAGNNCGIGLHLNTTWGKAMIQEPASFKYATGSEIPEEKYGYNELKNYKHGKVARNKAEMLKMRNELFAQYISLKNYLGGAEKIDAISSHQNFHFYDYQFVEILCEISREGDIPFRSLRRWEKEEYPDLETTKYSLGTNPLERVATAIALAVVQIPSTHALMEAAIKKSKLRKLTRNLFLQGCEAIPNNNTGHWFGQPSPDAMKWFIEALQEINQRTESGGYTSEIYMHLASSIDGEDAGYDYKMLFRHAEYLTIMKEKFIADFKVWKDNAKIEHGSYRKVLQGVEVDYGKVIA